MPTQFIPNPAAKDRPMLANGSNPEGQFPDPPFDIKSKEDFTDMVLVGPSFSPPSGKSRVYLHYGKIKHKWAADLSKVMGMKQPEPKSYDPLPWYLIGGRQMNDCYVFLQHIIPHLGLEYNHEWEMKLTTQYDPGMRVYRSGADWARLLHVYSQNSEPLAHMLGPIFRGAVSGQAQEKADKPVSEGGQGNKVVHPAEVGKEFRAALGTRKFFHGDQPGHVDLSFYGIMAVDMYAETDLIDEVREKADLNDWIERMQEVVPLNEVFGPFYEDRDADGFCIVDPKARKQVGPKVKKMRGPGMCGC